MGIKIAAPLLLLALVLHAVTADPSPPAVGDAPAAAVGSENKPAAAVEGDAGAGSRVKRYGYGGWGGGYPGYYGGYGGYGGGYGGGWGRSGWGSGGRTVIIKKIIIRPGYGG